MLFSTITFALFFLPYLVLHRLTPPRFRNYIIIIGSLIFYGWWRPEHLWIPIVLIFTAFAGGRIIAKSIKPKRKLYFISTLIALCLPLLFFKYFDFAAANINSALGYTAIQAKNMPIPLGISFITFTLISFLADAYKNKIHYKIGLASFASYILFFPQLIAGPILRPNELIPQLTKPKPSHWRLRSTLVAIGIFTIGLTKKIIFADQIAKVVEPVYASLSTPQFEESLLAIYGFSVQIYCDFSGYIDMATGIALLLGVRLPINFKQPYCSLNITDFWRRWHITLSNWLRDYLYIPLGGSRHGASVQARNLITTMAIGGLWHGANWTFLLWGLFQGAALILTHQFKNTFKPLATWKRAAFTILTFHAISFLWILFRAETISHALNVIQGLFNVTPLSAPQLINFISQNAFYIFLIVSFCVLHHLDDHRRIALMMRRLKLEVLIPLLAFLVLACAVVGQGSSGAFIYFEF